MLPFIAGCAATLAYITIRRWHDELRLTLSQYEDKSKGCTIM